LVIPRDVRSEPFFGDWDQLNNPIGMGIKKHTKKGDGLLTSLFGIPQSQTWNSVPLLGKLI